MLSPGGLAGVVGSLLLASSSTDRLLYDHEFHAGNYADVVKHSVLVQLFHSMHQKASPMCYAETHAGAGAYELESRASRRLSEHERGIDAVVSNTNDGSIHPTTEKLLELMRHCSQETGEGDRGSIYPGSPLIAASLCREQDSLVLCEKEPEPFRKLEHRLGRDHRATLIHDNGYKALRTFGNLQSQKRALVLVDPPYQLGSDTEQIVRLVKFWQTHWRSARVAVWHPVSEANRERADQLYDQMAEAVGGGKCLAAECYDAAAGAPVGTGMLLVHPPYGIEEPLTELLGSLGKTLGSEATARVRVEPF